MLTTSILLGHPAVLAVVRLRAWAVDSQQHARRNAMVAATACAERRAQREDVQDYLARRASASPGPVTADAPGDRAAEA